MNEPTGTINIELPPELRPKLYTLTELQNVLDNAGRQILGPKGPMKAPKGLLDIPEGTVFCVFTDTAIRKMSRTLRYWRIEFEKILEAKRELEEAGG